MSDRPPVSYASRAVVTMNWADPPFELATKITVYLICSAVGHRVALFWCTTDHGHPAEGWAATATSPRTPSTSAAMAPDWPDAVRTA